MKRAHIAALMLVAAAALYWWAGGRQSPPPPPPPAAEIDLTSAFSGPTAGEDASSLAAMCEAVADMIEWDGAQPEPLLSTGKALDQLRTRTRQFQFRGQSLGDRHPKMRQIVGDFLAAHLGSDGGKVTVEQRAQWVSTYREIAKAARHAVAR